MSNHHLSGSNQSFVNQLSTVSIPNSMQEALADLRWRAAMNEEMKTLQKKKNLGNLLIVHQERNELDVDGFIL